MLFSRADKSFWTLHPLASQRYTFLTLWVLNPKCPLLALPARYIAESWYNFSMHSFYSKSLPTLVSASKTYSASASCLCLLSINMRVQPHQVEVVTPSHTSTRSFPSEPSNTRTSDASTQTLVSPAAHCASCKPHGEDFCDVSAVPYIPFYSQNQKSGPHSLSLVFSLLNYPTCGC